VKALTVKNPWAWAIIHGGKDVENRSRPTKYQGQLFIHAGKGWSHEGQEFLQQKRTPFGFQAFPLDEWQKPNLIGKVIGSVDVVDCHHASECQARDDVDNLCSEWAIADSYHWVLANPEPLALPFPMKGKLGIWNMEGS
jgi:hypothetical protein